MTAPFWCDYGYNIHLGDRFYANHNCVMLDAAPITFGSDVYVGPDCGFYTSGHPLEKELRNAGLEYAHPITVGNDVVDRRRGAHHAGRDRRRQRRDRERKHRDERHPLRHRRCRQPMPSSSRTCIAGDEPERLAVGEFASARCFDYNCFSMHACK